VREHEWMSVNSKNKLRGERLVARAKPLAVQTMVHKQGCPNNVVQIMCTKQ